MPTLDPAAALNSSLEFAHSNLTHDLNALSEEQAAAAPQPGTRTAIHIVAECGAINTRFAAFLSAGEWVHPSPQQRDAYYAGISSRADALSALESGTQALREAISTRPADTWGTECMNIFGKPSTLFGVAEGAVLHMMYHDGQLNYLHTLHGDPEMHWQV